MDNKALVEAALFMAGRGMGVSELERVTGVDRKRVDEILKELREEYAQRGSGIVVEYTGRKAFMQVRSDLEDEIMHLAPGSEMGQAMLKTLAVIAYEGPVAQSQLVKQRGTRVYHYVKKLLERELISARKHGRTKLLSVTPKFNDYFKLDEVPKDIEVGEPEGSSDEESDETSEEPAEEEVHESKEEPSEEIVFEMK